MPNDILENLSSIEILGLTIIGEARGESIEGQVAVGSVIRNRLLNGHRTYYDVCLAPKQFSCWNLNDPNRAVLVELAEMLLNGQALTSPAYRQCMFVAKGIVSHELMDNTNGAVNYMTTDLFESKTVQWAENATNLSTKGNHTFFNA